MGEATKRAGLGERKGWKDWKREEERDLAKEAAWMATISSLVQARR